VSAAGVHVVDHDGVVPSVVIDALVHAALVSSQFPTHARDWYDVIGRPPLSSGGDHVSAIVDAPDPRLGSVTRAKPVSVFVGGVIAVAKATDVGALPLPLCAVTRYAQLFTAVQSTVA
jgi:hypothetical protein